MRFLVGEFSSVVHKVKPDMSADEMAKLLDEDPDYFNDLAYDNVVAGMTHVLPVASQSFPYRVPTPGTKDDKSIHSFIMGGHFVSCGSELKATHIKIIQRNGRQSPAMVLPGGRGRSAGQQGQDKAYAIAAVQSMYHLR